MRIWSLCPISSEVSLWVCWGDVIQHTWEQNLIWKPSVKRWFPLYSGSVERTLSLKAILCWIQVKHNGDSEHEWWQSLACACVFLLSHFLVCPHLSPWGFPAPLLYRHYHETNQVDAACDDRSSSNASSTKQAVQPNIKTKKSWGDKRWQLRLSRQRGVNQNQHAWSSFSSTTGEKNPHMLSLRLLIHMFCLFLSTFI